MRTATQTLALIVPILIAATWMYGQASPSSATFEAASIHQLEPPYQLLKSLKISGTRIALEGYNVTWLLAEAYGLKDYQVPAASIPRALLGTYYSIEARAPGETAPAITDVRAMLRNLLADRFHLTMHRETRNMPVYALVIDRNGPTLKPGTGDAECASLIGPVKPADRNYRYRFTNCTLERFVNSLPADRPVLDKTGLTGRYDISIFVTPEFRMRDNNEPGDVTFADAVRQLGLRLDAQNAPIDVVVVDHVEPPTPN